ncbi:minichromosome maintenance protein MCM [Salinigranum halophilum]|uniref:minichromosome maintenance protein MCM n=1 Tax=Salinigranum halophilum TaxID=2565931 RepID=UPI00115E4652|nr:minichromosome maintenance protein MCM [Salinigranum halophilum]
MPPRDHGDIVTRFREFYRDEYSDKIEEFAEAFPDNQRSLHLYWRDLDQYDSNLAEKIRSEPEQSLERAAEALRRHSRATDADFSDAKVLVARLDETTPLSDLRTEHLGTLIEVTGMVKDVSPVISALSEGAWECEQCGAVTHRSYTPSRETETTPDECTGCGQQGPFSLDHSQSEWVDRHSFVIEEQSQACPSETIIVKVPGDATGRVAAGKHVQLTGVLRREELGERNGSSLPDKYIEPYATLVGADAHLLDLSGEDRDQLLEISQATDVYDQVVDSVAPSIHGHREEKLAIALQLFSGVSKRLPQGSRISGDIHVLLVGDPGTAKTTLGDAARRLSSNGIRITVTTHESSINRPPAEEHRFDSERESVSNLFAGDVNVDVADFLFVDDVNQLSSQARGDLLNSLEGREANEAKSEPNRRLPRQASVLCTGSPEYGRFDQYVPISNQLNISPTLLSQFDLIFTLTDIPAEDTDRDVADHVIQRHLAGERYTNRSNLYISHVSQADVDEATEGVTSPIEADLLRKYIAFAKRNCYPTMTDDANRALREFYVNLRAHGSYEDTPVPVTAKKLEALVKLAEASARIRLSDTVTTEDTERVLGLVKTSLHQIGIDPETGEFDVDIIEHGVSKTQRDRLKNMKLIVEELQKDHELGAPVEKILDRAKGMGIDRSKAEECLEELRDEGRVYQPHGDHFRAV